MRTYFITVQTLRNHLAKILKATAREEATFFIMRHGKEVAQIIPVYHSRLRSIKRILKENNEQDHDMAANIWKYIDEMED